MTVRLFFLFILFWSHSIFAQTCPGLASSITVATSNQCLVNSPVLKVSGAFNAGKIEWYNGASLVATNILKIDNTVGVTVAGSAAGSSGNSNALLNTPFGVAVDSVGNVYVSDKNNHRVMKWAKGAASGSLYAGTTGSSGFSSTQFKLPNGIFMSSSGTLYVSDQDNSRVQKFLPGSNVGTTVAGGNNNGGTLLQLSNPAGIFVDSDSNVYVADAGRGPLMPSVNNRIVEWSTKTPWKVAVTAGVVVAGKVANELSFPTGVYVDKLNNIFVADFYNKRVQEYVKATGAINTVADLANIGGAGKPAYPTDVFLDESTNTLYITATDFFPAAGIITNTMNHLLKWNLATGTHTIVNSSAGAGDKLLTPSSLTISPNGSIYVVDEGKHRVQAWTKSIDTTYTPTTAGTYTAVVYNVSGCSVASNPVVVSISTTPSLSIVANPSGSICPGANVTFTATPTNGGGAPTYQWKKNGVNVGTGNTYSTNGLNNNDVISCVLTANHPCQTTATATSNTITQSVLANNPPSISISTPTTNICSGINTTFTAIPVDAGSNPTYQWQVNGINVGNNSSSFSSATLNDKDTVSCQLTRVAAACTKNTAISNPLSLTVNKPTVSTSAASICTGGSIIFNGTSYTTAGTYTTHLTNSKGCDSAASLVLTVKAVSTSLTNASICIGDSYPFNGTAYNTSGTYSAHLTNAVGCDSAATLVLTTKSPSTSTTTASICTGSTYLFNGTVYSSAGTYVAHLINSVGCDSAASLILTIKSPSTSTTTASICTGSTYLFNGTIYSSAGTYIAHLTNSIGCDSVATLILKVKSPSTSTTTASICTGSSYLFNGTIYSSAGTYIAHLTNSDGCDSAATLVLAVKSPSTSITNASICTGSTYTFNGTSYNTGGTYTAHLVNAVSCDSTATLNLSVKSLTTSITNASICAGSSYNFNGSNYTSAGTFTVHLTNANGCDSAATLNLSIKSLSASITNATINLGSTYTFNGTNYSSSGTYIAHLTNSIGCDSAATLILIVKSNTVSTTTASICAGNTYSFNGTTYSSAGTFVAHLTNIAGFDSAATLILTVKSLSSSITNANICAGGSYTFNGTNYTITGTYVAHLTNSDGCDSAATLNLLVKQNTTSTTNASICIGSSYTFNGTVYSSAGTYVAHLTNAKGCDSAATLILSIKQNTTSITNASFCSGTSFTFNGTNYSSAGTYTAHLINAAGCDSAATLILTATQNVTPSITISASTTAICSGSAVTFTAIPTNEGALPVFQWKINNVNAGTNSNSFTTTSLSNNDVVSCILTANNTCQTANTVNSNSIKINVSSSLVPSIVITPSANSVCAGSTVSFAANIVNGGTNPIIQWTKNGVNVGNGTITYADASLNSGDAIVCNLTSNSTCVTQSNAVSNIYKAVVNSNPIITTKNISPSCGVSSVDLSSTINSNTTGLSFTYYTDAALTISTVNPITVAGTYFIKATNTNGCKASASVVINNFKSVPIVTTKQNSTPCGVKAYNLNNGITSNLTGLVVAFYSDAALTQLATNPVTVSGTYFVAVTNADGCTASANIVVSPFQDLPVIEPIVGPSVICNQSTTVLTNKTSGGVWTCISPTIATINANGLVKGINVGVATFNYTVTNQCGQQVVPKYVYVSGNKVITTVETKNPNCIHPFFGKISPTVSGNEGPYKYLLNYGYDTLFNTAENLSAGNYTIDIYNANNCLVDSIKKQLVSEGNCDTVYLPTAFMPESNLYGGQNKFLRPFGGSTSLLKSIHFTVYNRFGYKVYDSQDIYMQGWDGRINGILQNAGTYIWELEYTLQSGFNRRNSGYSVMLR